jgi:hypothetical protein
MSAWLAMRTVADTVVRAITFTDTQCAFWAAVGTLLPLKLRGLLGGLLINILRRHTRVTDALLSVACRAGA